MDTQELFTAQDRDEIESAAELAGITYDTFVSRCVLWVLFNFPEAVDRRSVDKMYHSVV